MSDLATVDTTAEHAAALDAADPLAALRAEFVGADDPARVLRRQLARAARSPSPATGCATSSRTSGAGG